MVGRFAQQYNIAAITIEVQSPRPRRRSEWISKLVIVFVRIAVRPEKLKEVSQTFHALIAQVRRERGCLHAGFYQDAESETDFLLVEEWASQRDSDDHLNSDIFTVLIGAGTLMQRPPEILLHTIAGSARY